MKRAHRRSHLLIWLLLAPAMAALLFAAIAHRPPEPVQDTLPTPLLQGAS